MNSGKYFSLFFWNSATSLIGLTIQTFAGAGDTAREGMVNIWCQWGKRNTHKTFSCRGWLLLGVKDKRKKGYRGRERGTSFFWLVQTGPSHSWCVVPLKSTPGECTILYTYISLVYRIAAFLGSCKCHICVMRFTSRCWWFCVLKNKCFTHNYKT